MDSRVATAKTVADPVFSVIHQTRPNWAIALPIHERVCPVHMVKNRGTHFEASQDIVRFGKVVLVSWIIIFGA
jgi:hypothetical protein